MGSTSAPEHRGCDLATREEVAEFVTRFYREVAQDERFHHWFEVIAHIDWHVHTAELTDFWAAILLGDTSQDRGGERHRADRVIEAHRWLHDADAFDVALFDHWLEIFDATLTGGWSGPIAETASRRAHGIAWAMAKRLTGHGTQPRPTAMIRRASA